MESIESIANWFDTYYICVNRYPFAVDRIKHSFSSTQLESKQWLGNELTNLNTQFTNTAIVGGWYCHFLAHMLNPHTQYMCNYETDPYAALISKTFNRHIKDKFTSSVKDLHMEKFFNQHVDKGPIDLVVNTSCAHMHPFWLMREKIESQLDNIPLYVLQSTDHESYRDHINCVSGPDELADQARIVHVEYMGTKVLSNGMKRFMVIGK